MELESAISAQRTLRQAADELRGVLQSEGLEEPEDAARIIGAELQTKPSQIFDTGLCAGYPLVPAPREFFVAQEFSADRADLFEALAASFAAWNLIPYRADQDMLPGHILCKIAAKIQTTLFGVFEMTATQNRNVYLELGIAIGMSRPFVLVKEADAVVPPLAEGLDFYHLRSYAGLRRELGKRTKEYLLNITRYAAQSLPRAGSAGSYILSHGDVDMPGDFCLAVAEGLKNRNARPIPVGADNRETADLLQTSDMNAGAIEAPGQTRLDLLIQAIQTARFGIYRIDAACSADAFLALGIAIGLNRPWLLVSRDGAPLPADVRGLSGIVFRAFAELQALVPRRFGAFLDRHAG